jgi:hypothetical protein
MFMECTNSGNIGHEDQTDYVTVCIRRLAIGMTVVGAVFATLDWYQLLPSLPVTAVGL